jgi:HSP20 family protein
MARELTPWRRQAGLQPFQSFARDPFASFRREMDRLLDDFFAPAEGRSFAPAARGEGMIIMPNVDVHETDEAYTVTAELPGIELKDIELSLDDNLLTLRGEKRSERKEEQAGLRYNERSYGRFERSIPFAAEIAADKVDATCEAGVLKVTLPKTPPGPREGAPHRDQGRPGGWRTGAKRRPATARPAAASTGA